ncbi:unnamed protein product [Eruca vesicaria subsp. sativa]|uniref:ATPase AAA-type core domain-containing protein n=1 Tax=Eruca vesicaria subsp. sativa TaxID=29727 RepID=A0ABC8LPG7_ERUVS|nr:unnamed protein product [Eruca vesicaria subsp. sativa]
MQAKFNNVITYIIYVRISYGRALKKRGKKKKSEVKGGGVDESGGDGLASVIACDVINPDHIDVEFGSIGGLETIKETLYELVILPLKRPELFAYGKLFGPQKGVLLYWPPVVVVFSLAYKLQSAIIFIDEVDSFLGQCHSTDHEAMANMKTEFMALWDGFSTDPNNGLWFLLQRTNHQSLMKQY